MSALAFSLVLSQFLAPHPEIGTAGEDVRVEARSADGEPMPGIVVRVRPRGGEYREIGTTNAAGVVTFRPEVEGDWALRAEVPGRRLALVVPLYVAAPSRRWLWALLCVPAGLAVIVWNWRRLQLDRALDG